MMTEITESKSSVKHISFGYGYRLDGKKCNSKQKWNNDKQRHECKKPLKQPVKTITYGSPAYEKLYETDEYLNNTYIKQVADNLVIIYEYEKLTRN